MMFNTIVLTDNSANVSKGLYLQSESGKNDGHQWHVSYNKIHDKAEASFTMQKAGILHFTGCDDPVDRSGQC